MEVYLLCVFGGITLLAYLIAINAQGPLRLSVSYLFATLMLAATVWATVQYVNTDRNRIKTEEFQRLEFEKQKTEEIVRSQEQELLENKTRMGHMAKFNDIITDGTSLSATMISVDMRDYSVELDEMMARASEIKRRCDELKARFKKIENEHLFFGQTKTEITEALDQITGAAAYYTTYFRSEDGSQEEMRERMMRQKARKANDLFKKAASSLTAGN
jgi:uncharacterized protein YeeX (DUF496 family)